MTLLDATGSPLPGTQALTRADAEEIDTCSRCGKKEVETFQAFGGYWTRKCNQCGLEIAAGRGA